MTAAETPGMGSDRRSGRVESVPGITPGQALAVTAKTPESMVSPARSAASPERRRRVSSRALQSLSRDLTPRERAILQDVDRFHFLTTIQLQSLHFHDHQTPHAAARICRRVLARLAELRLLDHLERRIGGVRAGSAAFVWRVGPVGERLLRTSNDAPRARRKEPSLRHLEHSLGIADCSIALVGAARSGRLEVLKCEPEPASWRHYLGPGAVPEVLKPDLYAVTANGDYEDHWFIEFDRATESLPTVLRKCAQYERYRRSGREQAAIQVFPRVVWVVPDQRRVAALAAAIRRQSGSDELFRVTTASGFLGVITGDDV